MDWLPQLYFHIKNNEMEVQPKKTHILLWVKSSPTNNNRTLGRVPPLRFDRYAKNISPSLKAYLRSASWSSVYMNSSLAVSSI